MPARIREAPLGAAIFALICIVGCGQPTTYGTRGRDHFWSSGAGATSSVPGIDEGSVSLVTLTAGPPEGLSFAVWSDLPNGAAGHGSAGSGGSTPGASYEGHHRASDGRRVEFRAKTVDGKSGNITIAGIDYNIANGSLFLVSAREDPPRVSQITFDLSGFPKDDTFKEFAKSSPQIRDFFEKHKKEGANNKQPDG